MSRYGKQVAIQMKVTVKDKGKTRTFFKRFPTNQKSYDRPTNALTKIVYWFLETFRTIDPLSAVLAPAKYSVSTHDKIMEIILAEGEYADK